MENKEIQVILHNDNKIMPFKVKVLDTIKTIKNELKMNSQTLFIHNNSVLLSAFSFAFYGITEGSHILCVSLPENEKTPICSMEKQQNSPSLVKSDSNSNSGIVKNLIRRYTSSQLDDDEFPLPSEVDMDPIIRKEAAKLKDRMFQRMEGTIKLHRKFLCRFIQSSGAYFSSADKKVKDKKDDGADNS